MKYNFTKLIMIVFLFSMLNLTLSLSLKVKGSSEVTNESDYFIQSENFDDGLDEDSKLTLHKVDSDNFHAMEEHLSGNNSSEVNSENNKVLDNNSQHEYKLTVHTPYSRLQEKIENLNSLIEKKISTPELEKELVSLKKANKEFNKRIQSERESDLTNVAPKRLTSKSIVPNIKSRNELLEENRHSLTPELKKELDLLKKSKRVNNSVEESEIESENESEDESEDESEESVEESEDKSEEESEESEAESEEESVDDSEEIESVKESTNGSEKQLNLRKSTQDKNQVSTTEVKSVETKNELSKEVTKEVSKEATKEVSKEVTKEAIKESIKEVEADPKLKEFKFEPVKYVKAISPVSLSILKQDKTPEYESLITSGYETPRVFKPVFSAHKTSVLVSKPKVEVNKPAKDDEFWGNVKAIKK